MANGTKIGGAVISTMGSGADVDLTITPKGAAQVVITSDVNAGGGYRQTLDGWHQSNVAASQTGVALARLAGVDDNPAAWIAPRAGSVTAVAVHSSAARSAGTATVTVTIDGVARALTAVLNGGATTFASATSAKDSIPFAAGALIGATITTDGGWLPTTADIRVAIEIES